MAQEYITSLDSIKNNKSSVLYKKIDYYFYEEFTPILSSLEDWYDLYEQDFFSYQEKLIEEINEFVKFEGTVDELLNFYNYKSLEEAMIKINGNNWRNKIYHNNDIEILRKT